MAGLLFLADVLAFVLLLHWAFSHRAPGRADGDTGWFAMKSGVSGAPQGQKPVVRGRGRVRQQRTPGWKR